MKSAASLAKNNAVRAISSVGHLTGEECGIDLPDRFFIFFWGDSHHLVFNLHPFFATGCGGSSGHDCIYIDMVRSKLNSQRSLHHIDAALWWIIMNQENDRVDYIDRRYVDDLATFSLFIICSAASLAAKKVPFRFIANTRSQSFSVISNSFWKGYNRCYWPGYPGCQIFPPQFSQRFWYQPTGWYLFLYLHKSHHLNVFCRQQIHRFFIQVGN